MGWPAALPQSRPDAARRGEPDPAEGSLEGVRQTGRSHDLLRSEPEQFAEKLGSISQPSGGGPELSSTDTNESRFRPVLRPAALASRQCLTCSSRTRRLGGLPVGSRSIAGQTRGRSLLIPVRRRVRCDSHERRICGVHPLGVSTQIRITSLTEIAPCVAGSIPPGAL
jgi:hypothetical protein